MTRQIFVINPNELDNVWDNVKEMIVTGLFTSQGELTIDQARLLVLQGVFKLLISKDIKEQQIKAVALLEFTNFPNYLECA